MSANLQASRPGRILVTQGGPAGHPWIRETLEGQGFEMDQVVGLAGVLKKARAFMPAAAIVDLDVQTLGGDHFVRVLRQTHPTLPIVALASSLDTVIAEIVREFRLPLLIKPYSAASLLAALQLLGVAGSTECPPPLAVRDVAAANPLAAVSDR